MSKEEKLINVEFICPICGITHYLYKLPESKVDRVLNRRKNGESIQDIFPDMNKLDREKFITGYCDECQKEIFHYEVE